MNMAPNNLTLENNPAAQRFEARVDQHLAQLAYEQSEQRIIFTHTEVPEQLRGQGIAAKLARIALEHARTQGLTVVPRCPFVKGYIEKHPEFQDLLA
jgi:hypothetical protein